MTFDEMTFYGMVKFVSQLPWQYWKNVAWHLQISNSCFYQVSELWPMGLLLMFSFQQKKIIIDVPCVLPLLGIPISIFLMNQHTTSHLPPPRPPYVKDSHLSFFGYFGGTRDQRRLWSDCAGAQSGLSLRWSHKSYCEFCRASAHLTFSFEIRGAQINQVANVMCMKKSAKQ